MASLSWHPLRFLGLVNAYLKPFAIPQLCLYVCVCVCVSASRKIVVGAICKAQRSCNSRLVRPLRSQGARLHSQTNNYHVDFTDNLDCEQVISRPQNLGLMQLPVFKEKLKYTTPTYMKTHKTIHHQ